LKRVLLGISGGIAAYKSAELVRLLTKQGYCVRVVMTEAATQFISHGANTLSDAELLAIFLRTGLPGKSAVDLAQELLEDFGSLRALMQADCATFTQGKGLGNAKYPYSPPVAIDNVINIHLSIEEKFNSCHNTDFKY
jgi:ERCC4-type nuclease